jgi:hypothetical protein
MAAVPDRERGAGPGLAGTGRDRMGQAQGSSLFSLPAGSPAERAQPSRRLCFSRAGCSTSCACSPLVWPRARGAAVEGETVGRRSGSRGESARGERTQLFHVKQPGARTRALGGTPPQRTPRTRGMNRKKTGRRRESQGRRCGEGVGAAAGTPAAGRGGARGTPGRGAGGGAEARGAPELKRQMNSDKRRQARWQERPGDYAHRGEGIPLP